MKYSTWIVLLILLFSFSDAKSIELTSFEDESEFLCRVFDEKVNRYRTASQNDPSVQEVLKLFEERANKDCNNYFKALGL